MGSALLPHREVERERDRLPATDPEALIEEARGRQRRRRRLLAIVVVSSVGLLALAFAALRGSSSPSTPVAASTASGVVVDPAPFEGRGELAFVSLGGLYVLDGTSGKVRVVAGRDSDVSDPQFSPDGRWLTYTLGNDNVGLARADGRSPRTILDAANGTSGAGWLADGRLVVGRRILGVAADGRLIPDGTAPAGLVAWAADGSRYAFVSRTIVDGENGSFHGVERLQVAGSLRGERTTWLSDPVSFTRTAGFDGGAISRVVVLPHRQGVLFWIDPDQSASLAADGMHLYELRAAGAQPVDLGVTVGNTLSVGPGGKLAVGAGGSRYAWESKNVQTCVAQRARCSSLRTAPGDLTIDPAWSPNGTMLAFVQAASETAGAFSQPVLLRWYATHHLWVLRAGSANPTEVADTQGAASPVWSANGKSLLFVSRDALWLIAHLGASPVKIAGPLFAPTWPSYYGQVQWGEQFSWSSR